MPVMPFHIVDKQHEMSTQEQIDYLTNEVAKLQKTVRYLMNGGLDTDNVNELNANVVNAGTLNTNLVTVRAEDGNRYYQINENGIQAFNGSIYTLLFDLASGNLSISGIIEALGGRIGGWSIVGNALYSSTSTYPRVVLDPDNSQIMYYFTETSYIMISSDQSGQFPAITFVRGGRVSQIGQGMTEFLMSTVFGQDMVASAGGNLRLIANSGNVQFQSWGKIFNSLLNQTLEQALNNKLDRSGGVTNIVEVVDGLGNSRVLNFVNGQLVAIV